MQGYRHDHFGIRDRADRELAQGLDPVTLASGAPAGDIRIANTDAVGRGVSIDTDRSRGQGWSPGLRIMILNHSLHARSQIRTGALPRSRSSDDAVVGRAKYCAHDSPFRASQWRVTVSMRRDRCGAPAPSVGLRAEDGSIGPLIVNPIHHEPISVDHSPVS